MTIGLIRWETDAPMHCTHPAKFFPKSSGFTWYARVFFFASFLQFDIFITKSATFISKKYHFYIFDF